MCSSNLNNIVKSSIYQYWSTQHVTMLPSPAYQRCSLQRILPNKLWENSSQGWLHTQMLSAFIHSLHSYTALQLALQQLDQRQVHPGPLVLRIAPFNFPTPMTDRDRTVSRRSEPSSRAALMGEQPNPWKRLHLQDATSRHRGAKHHRLCELLGGISLLSPG